MKGRSYGWKRHMFITVGIAGIIGIGCIGCGAESGTKAGDIAASEAISEAAERNETEAEDGEEIVSVMQMDENDFTTDEEDAAIEEEEPLLEQLFSYEKNRFGDLVITGIAEEYRDIYRSYMEDSVCKMGSIYSITCLQIPKDINGVTVKEIGENAFANMTFDKIVLPDSLEKIGSGAFRNTLISEEIELPDNLREIGARAFERCRLEYIDIPDSVELIEERAFAENLALWTVLVSNNSTLLEKDVFVSCAKDFLLCYGDSGREKENLVEVYAKENGFDYMEIILSMEPIVNYPEEPLVLRSEVSNFFYGDDGDDEQWCTWEEDVAAPNFGYSDWQWAGCSDWCGVLDFELSVEASSELASENGRYSSRNVTGQSREAAWSEGVDGNGIGESLVYRQSCVCGTDNQWDAICQWKGREPRSDGFQHYTEICIVNGYARDEKVWEENGRIKELLMYVEGKPYAYLELEDTILPQYFTLPEDDIKVLNGGMLEVRFEITDVYPGSVYEDTCLTGLVMEFSGRYAH